MTSGPRASRWRQLGLALPHEPHYSGADFLVSQSNVAALRMIESWPQWPDKVLLLVGAPGSGKSHLSAIWAAQAGAESLSSGHLAGSDMAELAALAAKPALVIDDADALGGAEAPIPFAQSRPARRPKPVADRAPAAGPLGLGDA